MHETSQEQVTSDFNHRPLSMDSQRSNETYELVGSIKEAELSAEGEDPLLQHSAFDDPINPDDQVETKPRDVPWIDQQEYESSFKKWINDNSEKCGDHAKTTITKQIELSMNLYCKAEKLNDEHGPTANDVLSELRQSPVNESLVRWRGISVDWLLDYFFKTPYVQELVSFGCELWFVRKVGIVELLRRKQFSNGAFVDHIPTASFEGVSVIEDKPTVFISYTGRTTFSHLVNALENIRGEYIWMDVFCVDQFAWTGRKDMIKPFRQQLLSELKSQIKRIGKTYLLLERWNNVLYKLQQAWVLWEIFNTSEADAVFEVLLPDTETSSFLSAVECGTGDFEKIQDSLTQINVVNARAEDSSDLIDILARVQERGIYSVNKIVTAQVRSWLIETMLSNLELQRRTGDPSVAFVHNVATLLMSQGRYSDAEVLWQELMESDDDGISHNAKSQMSLIKIMQWDYETAELLARSAYRGLLEAPGDSHEASIVDLHEATVVALVNLGNALAKKGDFEEAHQYFVKSVDTAISVFGVSNPMTLIVQTKYGDFLRGAQNGSLLQAEEILKKTYSTAVECCGAEDPITLFCQGSLLSVQLKLGKVGAVSAELEQVVKTMWRVLGRDNPAVLQVSLALGAALAVEQRPLELLQSFHMEAFSTIPGVDHLPSAARLAALHSSLFVTGKFSQAEENIWNEELLKLRLLKNGDAVPTALCFFLAAVICRTLGCLPEALDFVEEAVTILQESWYRTHPLFAFCRQCEAVLNTEAGQLERAEELFQDMLQEFPEDHPDAMQIKFEIAKAKAHRGTPESLLEAENLLEDILEDRRILLGNENLDTIDTMHLLATTRLYLCDYDGAEVLLKEALGSGTSVLGENHIMLVNLSVDLTTVYWFKKEYNYAERLAQPTFVKARQNLGPDHEHTLAAQGNLANVLMETSRVSEAETVLLEMVERADRVFGAQSREAGCARFRLGYLYAKHRRNYIDAQEQFAKASEGLERGLGPEHVETVKCRRNWKACRRTICFLTAILAVICGPVFLFGLVCTLPFCCLLPFIQLLCPAVLDRESPSSANSSTSEMQTAEAPQTSAEIQSGATNGDSIAGSSDQNLLPSTDSGLRVQDAEIEAAAAIDTTDAEDDDSLGWILVWIFCCPCACVLAIKLFFDECCHNDDEDSSRGEYGTQAMEEGQPSVAQPERRHSL